MLRLSVAKPSECEMLSLAPWGRPKTRHVKTTEWNYKGTALPLFSDNQHRYQHQVVLGFLADNSSPIQIIHFEQGESGTFLYCTYTAMASFARNCSLHDKSIHGISVMGCMCSLKYLGYAAFL